MLSDLLHRVRRSAARVLAMGGFLAYASCGDASSPVEPPDASAPGVEIVFPAAGAYDRDGDGLLDLEVAFTDSASGVDPASIRVTAGGRDVLSEWEVTRQDATGLVAEETVAGLLPAGFVTLEISVTDHAGNARKATRPLRLPRAALHRTIPLPSDPARRVQDVAMRPDGEVLFAVDETSELLLIDPNEYRLVAQPSGPLGDLEGIEYDARGNRVYAVSFLYPGLAEFDGTTGQFLRLIPTTEGAFTLALSRQTSEVYIPLEIEFESMNGVLSVVDRQAGQELALVQSGITHTPIDGTAMGQHSAVLTSDEARLYVTTGADGLLVYSPQSRELLEQIDLRPGDPRLGWAAAIVRVGNDMYTNVFRGVDVGSAIYRLDDATGAIEQIKDLGIGTDINTGAAASPDERWLFVTGAGGRSHVGPPNYLLSLPDMGLTHVEGVPGTSDLFAYKSVAWHPDGKRVYVAAGEIGGGENAIVVYLVRP